ncbi:hypothetical protein CN971_17030 [Bacillus thuringiensis]|nr:hypothetical protein COM82_27595 [Bacillus thuringiensis]PED22439.1 hypothetical protein CON34_31690 [Bacillus thuringiensis]PGN28272.1 hypothetical protein CN969_02495 [Bacillus thuringiensis]PGN30099.1 hypothetical protein CN971_17030 [Bacillus thuringiensis]
MLLHSLLTFRYESRSNSVPLLLGHIYQFFTKKFMIWLICRVRHYLTLTLRSPVDNRGFFY